jgi:glycosyltransferase involved in cell wall biosynthesis
MKMSSCIYNRFPLPKPVDVIVCTYNSERKLADCLQSIMDNVPVRKLWVIDNYSEDKTVEIAKDFNATVVQSHCSLAEARKLGFNLVETEYFVNVDSDIVLCKDWYRRVMQFWDSDKVGCVWGTALHMLKDHRDYQLGMYSFRRAESYRIPHLPDMVSRKSILRDILFKQPLFLGSVAGEDYEIMDWIVSKGFVCKTASVYVDHYTYPPLMHNKTFWGGACTRLLRRKSLLHILKQVVLSIPQASFVALVKKNCMVIPYWIQFRFEELYGFLHWSKYVILKR